MEYSKIIPLILAGGTGTRLWPVSRDSMPKQFLPLAGETSTYQQALQRVSDPRLFAEPIVMTSSDFRFFSRRQAEEIGIPVTIALEPLRRDSGPSIAAGTVLARNRDPGALVLCIAADHIIPDTDLFHTACIEARAAAESGHIVTFGIRPTSPKTSYGYIRPGARLQDASALHVDAFVEKPDASTAERCVAAGYLWNSGNFMFRADTLLQELARLQPEMAAAIDKAVASASEDLGFIRLGEEAYATAPQISIDYAVMEKTDSIAMIEGAFRWSDVGSWDALLESVDSDQHGNIVQGAAVIEDSAGCVVYSSGPLTATVGLKDTIVVSTPDAVLVVPRGRTEAVKHLVARLKNERRVEATEHRRCYRPWGHYEAVDQGDRFKVKRIVVLPGERLSLQKHMHRSEHWIVVRGTAEVTNGEATRVMHENESIYIPIGAVHRLTNPGKIALELIEVQTGSYLGEDDIVRFEDDYRRP